MGQYNRQYNSNLILIQTLSYHNHNSYMTCKENEVICNYYQQYETGFQFYIQIVILNCPHTIYDICPNYHLTIDNNIFYNKGYAMFNQSSDHEKVPKPSGKNTSFNSKWY